MNGTGHFGSGNVSCPHCCEKHYRNGKVEYYHQLMGAVIVHPDKSLVFPLFPEAITKQDGATKNDCENNAAKRLLPAIHNALPDLKFIVLQDAIGADAPNIKMIKSQGYSYIITVTAKDQVSLYNEVQERIYRGECNEFEVVGNDGITRGYRFVNNVPLNKSNPDVLVNYLDYWEIKDNKQIYSHQWISDIELTRENVNPVMRAGRWLRVENYVKFLTDHMRSVLRHAIKGHGVEHFYASAIGIVRDTVLGKTDDKNKRPGRLFEENGMRVYDVEVLNVTTHPYTHPVRCLAQAKDVAT
jgi:hypothetical protein